MVLITGASMGSDHKCPDDPFLRMFDVVVTRDGETYNAGCWDLDCDPSVQFDWDQWMVCRIWCCHGSVQGVACGINFMESFTKAVDQFNAFDHYTPIIPRSDGEGWADYFNRVRRSPLPA